MQWKNSAPRPLFVDICKAKGVQDPVNWSRAVGPYNADTETQTFNGGAFIISKHVSQGCELSSFRFRVSLPTLTFELNAISGMPDKQSSLSITTRSNLDPAWKIKKTRILGFIKPKKRFNRQSTLFSNAVKTPTIDFSPGGKVKCEKFLNSQKAPETIKYIVLKYR